MINLMSVSKACFGSQHFAVSPHQASCRVADKYIYIFEPVYAGQLHRCVSTLHGVHGSVEIIGKILVLCYQLFDE